MSKKTYKTPSAELIYLFPQEEISATWYWGTFSGTGASRPVTVDIWDAFNVQDGNDSYTLPD